MLFSQSTWNRIYDAENRTVTLTDGLVTITLMSVLPDREPECGQGDDGKMSPEREAWERGGQ